MPYFYKIRAYQANRASQSFLVFEGIKILQWLGHILTGRCGIFLVVMLVTVRCKWLCRDRLPRCLLSSLNLPWRLGAQAVLAPPRILWSTSQLLFILSILSSHYCLHGPFHLRCPQKFVVLKTPLYAPFDSLFSSSLEFTVQSQQSVSRSSPTVFSLRVWSSLYSPNSLFERNGYLPCKRICLL